MTTENHGVFVSNDGATVTAATADEAKIFAQAGYSPATTEQIKVNALREKFSNPLYGFAAGALGSVPFATTALVKGTALLGGDAAAQGLAEGLQASEDASPFASKLGFGAGIIGGAVLTGGASAAAGGVARGGALAAAKSIGLGAAKLGAQGALLGAGSASDAHALQYAQTGEGQEKLFIDMAQSGMQGAVFNILLGGALTGAGKAASALRNKGQQASQGLQDVASSIETKAALTSDALEQMGLKGQTEKVQKFAAEHKLFEMAPAERVNKLKGLRARAHNLMKEARFGSGVTLSQRSRDALVEDLTAVYKNSDNAVHAIINKLPERPTIRQLHDLRMNIDRTSNFYKNPALAGGDSVVQRTFIRGRGKVTEAIDGLVEASNNPQLAQAWRKANHIDHMANTILSGLKPQTGSTVGNSVAAGLGAAVGGSIGGPTGAAIGAGAMSSLAGQGFNRTGAKVMRGLAASFNFVDDAVAKVVHSRFANAIDAKKAASFALIPSLSYSQAADSVAIMAQRPQDAVENLSNHMQEKGVPNQVADLMVPYQQRAVSYLEAVRPKNPFMGQTATPVNYVPPKSAQRSFIEALNAIHNPMEAIANPTPGKIAALNAMYPNLLNRVQQVVTEESSLRPDLHPAAKRWAGTITGMAGNAAGTPQVQQGLAALKQAAQMKQQMMEQQSGGHAGPSAPPSHNPMVQQAISRTERMAR